MTFPRPWPQTRRGLYRFIRASSASVLEDGKLPDDDDFYAETEIRWIAGGADGASRHYDGADDAAAAAAILAAVTSVVADPTEQTVGHLYRLLIDTNTKDFLERFIALLDEDNIGTAPELAEFARWLATEAPDRRPVKFALALLGECGDSGDEDLFMTFGRHEEFTLFAAVALTRTLPNPEAALWQLARQVHGWGRIQLVDRLKATTNRDIKRWLLREGFRNRVMTEYLAYRCATTGDLRTELAVADPDDALMAGAGEILHALLFGGPAPDMSSYADGPDAVLFFLRHLARRPCKSPDEFLTVRAIKSYVADLPANPGTSRWTDGIRAEIDALAAALLGRPAWRGLAEAGLRADDVRSFRQAAAVLEALGIDAWEARFERQRAPEADEWFWLMKTDDPARIQRVLDLAEQHVDLDGIASGPANELGLGRPFRQHQLLDWLLQELGRFPGLGWSVVAAALRSPVTRNRHWAVKVLSRWGARSWPSEAPALLERVVAEEPDIELRQRVRNLVDGRPLEEGVIARVLRLH